MLLLDQNLQGSRVNCRGSAAVLMVMMMIALITTVGVEISYRAQMSASLVVNRRDHAKAYELAKASYRWSLLQLQLDSLIDTNMPAIPGTNFGGKKDDLTEMQWNLPLTFPFPTGGQVVVGQPSAEQQAETLGGTFQSRITDESAKLNLNDVGSGGPGSQKYWSGAAYILEDLLLSPRFKRFFRDGDHREILWAIEDWVDSDSQVNHTAGGIEDVEYALSQPGYFVKNGPFFTVDEIKLLKPMKPEIFQELKPFITVYPFDAKLPKISTQKVPELGKLNINTAPLELLAATINRQVMSSPKARLDCAQLIVRERSQRPFRSISAAEPSLMTFLKARCGGTEGSGEANAIISGYVAPRLDVRSDVFSIEASGIVGDVIKTIYAVVSRKDPEKIKIYYWKVT